MLDPECFVAVVGVLARKLEPAPLRTVIAALAPLVGSTLAAAVAKPRSRRKPKAQPKPKTQKAPPKAEPDELGPGGRAYMALQANPSLSASELAAAASCSRSTAVSVIKGRSAPRRSRSSERAQTLLRQQLASGPKRAEAIEAAAEAAEIPERSLVAAATALGVVTQNGQWRLPS